MGIFKGIPVGSEIWFRLYLEMTRSQIQLFWSDPPSISDAGEAVLIDDTINDIRFEFGDGPVVLQELCLEFTFVDLKYVVLTKDKIVAVWDGLINNEKRAEFDRAWFLVKEDHHPDTVEHSSVAKFDLTKYERVVKQRIREWAEGLLQKLNS